MKLFGSNASKGKRFNSSREVIDELESGCGEIYTRGKHGYHRLDLHPVLHPTLHLTLCLTLKENMVIIG